MISRPRKRFFLDCLAAIAIALCVAAWSPAPASSRYRIVLTSGQELASATCTPDYDFKVLRLETPAEKLVSFNRVRAVYDGGRDVTREVLIGTVHRFVPADSSGTPAHWVSEKSAACRAATRPRWRVALAGGGNFSAPFGDYYAAYAAGTGFDVAALVPFTRGLGIRAAVSRSGGKLGSVLDHIGYRSRIMRFSLSGVGYLHLSRSGADRSLVYSYAGLGSLSERMTFRPTGESATENHPLLTFGAGLMKTVTTNIAVEIGLSLDEVLVQDHLMEANLADLRSGLVILF